MRERTIVEDPREQGGEARRPHRAPEREGRGRGRSGRRERLGFRERSERALMDVGIYRFVPFRELAEAHFGGTRLTARRAVNTWIRQELARETTVHGEEGRTFRLLSLTRRGVSVARDLTAATKLDLDPDQRFTHVLHIHRPYLPHDAALYRAAREERERLAREGARIRRVRLEDELRATVLRQRQLARARSGQRGADAGRHRAARELGLPIDAEGGVLYPDAQIEYVDGGGRSGRVNIEVTSGHYKKRHILAKAAAGFRLHPDGPGGERLLGRLLSGGPGL